VLPADLQSSGSTVAGEAGVAAAAVSAAAAQADGSGNEAPAAAAAGEVDGSGSPSLQQEGQQEGQQQQQQQQEGRQQQHYVATLADFRVGSRSCGVHWLTAAAAGLLSWSICWLLCCMR
jgi:hypothetical protein